jgi:hypothetical protein
MTRIGVAGHQDLTTATGALLRSVLRRELRAHSPLTGVCHLLPGADQAFARAVLDAGGRLEVILPAADYREQRINTEHLGEFDELLAAARSVRVAGFDRCCARAYAAADAIMLGCVDCLIAVWDGRTPARLGGIGGAIVAAHRLGLPTRLIWPAEAARLSAVPAPPPAAPHARPAAPDSLLAAPTRIPTTRGQEALAG